MPALAPIDHLHPVVFHLLRLHITITIPKKMKDLQGGKTNIGFVLISNTVGLLVLGVLLQVVDEILGGADAGGDLKVSGAVQVGLDCCRQVG